MTSFSAVLMTHPGLAARSAPPFQASGEGLLGGTFGDLPASTQPVCGAEDDGVVGPVDLLESGVDSHATLSSP